MRGEGKDDLTFSTVIRCCCWCCAYEKNRNKERNIQMPVLPVPRPKLKVFD